MPSIEVRSPTRVDLAGGTLDCWPLYLFFGGKATTINLPISIYTRAVLTPLSDASVRIVSKDLPVDVRAANLEDFLAQAANQQNLQLYHILLSHFRPKGGFHLETSSESPVGAGLGGSSSLLMSCLKAFSRWQGLSEEPGAMIRLASNMEAQMLLKPTGTQDYYPACFPAGINIIDYGVGDARVTAIDAPAELFDQRFLLVYTGRSHHSGINNWDVIKKVIDGDSATLKALGVIHKVAEELRQKCLHRDWTAWPELFHRETQARLQLSDSFASPEIERLTQLALSAGAQAVKICGAGGGGCVFLWTADSTFAKVKQACQNEGFQVLDAKPLAARPATTP